MPATPPRAAPLPGAPTAGPGPAAPRADGQPAVGGLRDPEGGGGLNDPAPDPATANNQSKDKAGDGGARKAQGATVEEAAPPEQNRMESLLDHWNIPRPDVRSDAAAPPPTEGPPVTAVAADRQGKGGPGPDGLTLLFSLLVAAFVAGGGYIGYRNWSNRYDPA